MKKLVIKSAAKERQEDKSARAQKFISILRKESEEEQASLLAKKYSLPYVDLGIFPVNSEDVKITPEKDARQYQAAVFHKKGRTFQIGLTHPYDKKAIDYFKKAGEETGLTPQFFVISQSSLEKLFKKYKESFILQDLDITDLHLKESDLGKFGKSFKELLDLKKRILEIPTTQVINILMSGAIKMEASDIHLEPEEKDIRIRYRLDGILHDIGHIPSVTYKSILSRIKMMGKMKINLHDIAQDGHFSIEITGNQSKIDIRVSIIPGNYGESIVMRLLDQGDTMLKMEELGLRGLAYEQLQNQVAKPNGMILTTGPTGSGKTTTLYGILNKLKDPGVKIITIEDPIEYELKGISQTQVDKNKRYDFAKGLRAIVRQDPDIILVGEIRDDETADIAINAALTGHLVISTLHTNNAAATIPRIIELGVRPSLIAPSINAFMAQRLVRRLCPHCKEKYIPAKEVVDSIQKIISLISPKSKIDTTQQINELYRPKGCTKCHNIGYKGRVGIFEVLTINENIEKLILEMASENEIVRAALEDGMVTMEQDGVIKALEGITSIEEVRRVTGQTEFLEKMYEQLMEQSLSRSITIMEKDLQEVSDVISSFKKFDQFISQAKPQDLAKFILTGALLAEAGDIHIEPEEKNVQIKFRIDGIMQIVTSIPLTQYPALLGKIKMLSNLKTEERSGVNDSRFAINLEKSFQNISDKKVDVRVSIILGGFGETAVLRLLNKSATSLDVEKLNIRPENLEKIMKEIQKPNGIFLNTGPTGSGKTTTLYSILHKINRPELKIITVEDPIEYQLTGILQTQVNEKDGYNFSTALRSLLRQNPDILMVGEIRDEETAKISVQASLTGHLLISTLHTNDASSAISRLINMGVRPDDLATSVNAFMAQRLVRQLCPHCKEKRTFTAEEKTKIDQAVKTISPKTGVQIPSVKQIYQPKGCAKCNHLGYKGRTVISEVFIIDPDIEKLIYENALPSQIKKQAIEKGMLTMRQDGILKILEGETTLEEVERVTEEE